MNKKRTSSRGGNPPWPDQDTLLPLFGFFPLPHGHTFSNAIRVGLGFRARSTPIKNLRGMEFYDWLQNGFFINRGLHYNQYFFG